MLFKKHLRYPMMVLIIIMLPYKKSYLILETIYGHVNQDSYQILAQGPIIY